MSNKSAPDSSSLGCTLVLAFIGLLVVFLDASWVLGQQVWLHAFGERTEGRIVDTRSYLSTRKGGGSQRVSVHDYLYRDASGGIHVEQTGHKSILFSRERHEISGIPQPREDAPRVTVLYLRGFPSVSWAVEYEPPWAASIFLVAVLLLPLSLTAFGAYSMLKPGGKPGVKWPSRVPRAPAPSSRRKKRKKKRKH